MPDIRKIARPEIRLVGNIINDNGVVVENFSEVVDHFNPIGFRTTTSIQSESQLNKEDLITFVGSVRVIITGKVDPKPSYARQSSNFNSLTFEGKQNFNRTSGGTYSETFYSLNGKDPVRNSNYLYKFKDWDDFVEETVDEIQNPNPSTDPSNVGTNITTTVISNNLNDLGFLLKTNPTGYDVISLKTRTFYQGSISDTSTAYFKLYKKPLSTTIDNEDNNDNND